MKKILALILLSNLALSSLTLQRIIVPAYFYPEQGSPWAEMFEGESLEIVIVNPRNGPGDSLDSNYKDYVDQTHAAGAKVIGYVYTDYGERGWSDVIEDVDKYYSWYDVDGIFYDETPNDPGYESTYEGFYWNVKNRGGDVILNPGTVPSETYMPYSDIICIYEDSYDNYVSISLPSWVDNYGSERFCHIIHTASESEMQSTVSLSENRNVKYLYITDDVMDDPYDTLPSYWENLNSLIAFKQGVYYQPSSIKRERVWVWWDDVVELCTEKWDIPDPYFIAAIVKKESWFNETLYNQAEKEAYESGQNPWHGEYYGKGLMQITGPWIAGVSLPSTFEWEYNMPAEADYNLAPTLTDSYNGRQNLDRGCWYMKALFDHYNDDLYKIASAYRFGFQPVDSGEIDYSDNDYIDDVMPYRLEYLETLGLTDFPVGFVCTSGETKSCTTSENCPGTRTCINEQWGICIDISHDNCPPNITEPACTEGETRVCTTADNCAGTQLCIDEQWAYCYDNPDDNCPISIPKTCVEGDTFPCTVSDNCPGVHTCIRGEWSICEDIPDDGCPAVVPFVCADGETRDCTTTQNCPGKQTCINNMWSWFCIDNPGDNCPVEPGKEPIIEETKQAGFDYILIVMIASVLLVVFIIRAIFTRI